MGRVGRTVAIATLIVLCAACGGQATSSSSASSPPASLEPTVAPTATLTPSPTPTPTASSAEMKGIISKRYPYSIAIPVDWTEGEMGNADAFQGPAGRQVDVRFYESISDDPEAWFTKARDVLEGFAPVADERTVSHPAGAGRLFELHPTTRGRR